MGRAKTTRRGVGQQLATFAAPYLAAALLLSGAGGWMQAQTLTASASSVTTVGNIKGVAYDSLLMKPMVGVQVQLLDLNQSTRTNARGQFQFNRVPTGTHQLSLSAVELDSLGFGTIGTETTVIEGKTANVSIGPPSLRTIWSRNCYAGNIVGRDSGVVWGTIRDAETQRTLSEAAATFNWYDLGSAALSGILVREINEQAGTNADGVYFACGLPSDVAIASEGITTSAASGRIDYALGARRMQRLDLTVSREMIVADSIPADSTSRRDSLAVSRKAPRSFADVC
ncbi:MAG: carboxypeptidase regulatory-like domain-containing protein [Gemmatimonas sp.]